MNEDKIINKLIEIDEKIGRMEENMATKGDVSRITDELDRQSVILKRLDEERHFTVEWVRRIEADVDRIKTHLQIA
jgi:hypothetical protein